MRKALSRVRWNAPVTLGFAVVCLLAYLLNFLTGGAANRVVFSVYRASALSPLTWLRCVCHVFGHSSWSHLTGNLLYILLLGPMLEEKYGSVRLLVMMLVTALVTGLMNVALFPTTRLLGASGIVFAFLLLASFTGPTGDGTVPLTFILIAVIYIGEQLYQTFFVADNISHMAHIVGGLTGAAAGFLMNRGRR